jgi:hypothetical protein
MANTATAPSRMAPSELATGRRAKTKKWNPSSSQESTTGCGGCPASRGRRSRNSGERFSGARNAGSAQGRSFATASAAIALARTAGPAVERSPQRRRRGASELTSVIVA